MLLESCEAPQRCSALPANPCMQLGSTASVQELHPLHFPSSLRAVLEAFSGAPPFPGLSVAAVFFSVVHQQQRPALPPDMPLPLAALVCDCWQQQPEDRPPIQQARWVQCAGSCCCCVLFFIKASSDVWIERLGSLGDSLCLQVLASLRDVQTAAAGTRGSRGNLKP